MIYLCFQFSIENATNTEMAQPCNGQNTVQLRITKKKQQQQQKIQSREWWVKAGSHIRRKHEYTSASTSTRKITRREPGRRKHKHKKKYVWTCREDPCTCACILIALLCRTCGQRKHKHERKGIFLSVDISSLIEEKHCACVCPCVILISLVWTYLCLCLRRTCFQPLVIVAQCSHSKNMRKFYTKVEQ